MIDAIRPFRINVPDEALVDLRRRIRATRWPERETVTDQSQGVQLATIRELARYWGGTDYNWRNVEAMPPTSQSPLPSPSSPAKTPRSWAERAYHNLIYFNEVDKGGHFASWEQPQLFSEEVRAGFRPLRRSI
jgi:pimeloyl-ACP methyl ester carboxylesterase